MPPADAGLIASRLPQARLEIFDDCAHALMFPEMDRFVALVESFLAERA